MLPLHTLQHFESTSMTDLDTSTTADFYYRSLCRIGRKSIMYSKPDYTTFTVDGMEILISVYSPSGSYCRKHNAEMKTMMTAQKTF
jgi:hypothetical protein